MFYLYVADIHVNFISKCNKLDWSFCLHCWQFKQNFSYSSTWPNMK